MKSVDLWRNDDGTWTARIYGNHLHRHARGVRELAEGQRGIAAMSWYALAGGGGYLGRRWEILNSSPRRPRVAVVELQDCDVFPTSTPFARERSRARAILGVDFGRVEIDFEGQGRSTTIVLKGAAS